MRRIVFVASIGLSLFCIVSTARAAAVPSIVLPNVSLLPNTPNQVVPIQITGGEVIQGATLDFYVGSGGNTTSEPTITSATAIGAGTIFNSNNSGQNTDGTPTKQWLEINVVTSSGTVSASGLLADLIIDTTGISSGNFQLNLNGSKGNSELAPSIVPSVTAGSISVPEPASLGLLILGAGALLSRRSRKPARVSL